MLLYIMQDPSSNARQVDDYNLASVQDSDGSLKVEVRGTEPKAVEIEMNESRKSDINGGPTDVLDWSSHNDLDCETTRPMHLKENGHLSSDPENKDGKLEQFSSPADETMEKMKGGNYRLTFACMDCFVESRKPFFAVFTKKIKLLL